MCEAGLGGRVFERWHDGREHEWGRITAWSPPDRLAFTWSPSPSDDVDTNVEVTFGVVDGGTLVRLTHAGWDALGEAGGEKRAAYEAGWPHVLTRLLDATLGAVAHRAFARSANGETWRHLESGEAAEHEGAATWRTKAEDLGAAIADPQDREIFAGDLAAP